MTIKLLLLKSGEDVIADVQEMYGAEQQVFGYLLNNPCVIKLKASEQPSTEEEKSVSIRMHPWMPVAREKTIPITIDWVVTMVTPVEKVQEMYVKDVLNDGKDREEPSKTDSSDEQPKTGLTD